MARAGAGLNREGGEKVYLNPKINLFYKYNEVINIEAGIKRDNEKTGFMSCTAKVIILR